MGALLEVCIHIFQLSDSMINARLVARHASLTHRSTGRRTKQLLHRATRSIPQTPAAERLRDVCFAVSSVNTLMSNNSHLVISFSLTVNNNSHYVRSVLLTRSETVLRYVFRHPWHTILQLFNNFISVANPWASTTSLLLKAHTGSKYVHQCPTNNSWNVWKDRPSSTKGQVNKPKDFCVGCMSTNVHGLAVLGKPSRLRPRYCRPVTCRACI